MMIHVTPKRLKKITIEATFENKGIAYSERFDSKNKFCSYTWNVPRMYSRMQ